MKIIIKAQRDNIYPFYNMTMRAKGSARGLQVWDGKGAMHLARTAACNMHRLENVPSRVHIRNI